MLIALPSSEHYTYPRHAKSASGPNGGDGEHSRSLLGTEPEPIRNHQPGGKPQTIPASRATLRRYMIKHSLKGRKMLKVRTPFVGEVVTVHSPKDEEIEFGLKRVGNRELMAHRDRNAAVRYIQRTDTDEFISEKDYPVGTMKVDTLLLGLDSWNIANDQHQVVKIDRESILSYLLPEELDYLYDQALEINPILSGREARKND